MRGEGWGGWPLSVERWGSGPCLLHSGRKGLLQTEQSFKDVPRIKQIEKGREGGGRSKEGLCYFLTEGLSLSRARTHLF